MSAPKWTPGPWRRLPGETLEGHPDGPGWLRIQIVRARAPGETAFDKVALVNGDNVSANAHLIAAAPEMYEALAEMVETFKGYQGMELTTARAALAKARGETS